MKFGLCCGLVLWAGLFPASFYACAADDAPQPMPPFFAPGVLVSDQSTTTDILLAQQPPSAALQSPKPSPPTTMPRPGNTPPPGPTTTPPSTARADANTLALAPYSNGPSSTSGYSLVSVPNMIGDTLGVKYFFTPQDGSKRMASIPGGDQSEKIADDTSPIPTDRVFFDYNFFSDVFLTANGAQIGLNRYTFGVEKTFFDGMCSVEIKAPVDGGLNEVQSFNASTSGNQGTIFGTLAITPKVLLYQEQQFAMSAGMAIGLPTSPVAELITTQPIRVFDDSVRLAPFLGFLLAPDDQWFSITYLQLDFDANGDRVFQGDTQVGVLHAPTLLYVDMSVGYWLFNSSQTEDGKRSWLTGTAPILELHYTTTLQDAERVGGVIVPISQRVDFLNLTAGLYFQIGPVSSLLVGGVAPLRTSPADREFDAEVVVQFNRRF